MSEVDKHSSMTLAPPPLSQEEKLSLIIDYDDDNDDDKAFHYTCITEVPIEDRNGVSQVCDTEDPIRDQDSASRIDAEDPIRDRDIATRTDAKDRDRMYWAIDIETGQSFPCNRSFQGQVVQHERTFMENRVLTTICPISQEPFEKAMFCVESGVTYSLQSITDFVNHSHTKIMYDPMTRIPFSICHLIRNLYFWPAGTESESLTLEPIIREQTDHEGGQFDTISFLRSFFFDSFFPAFGTSATAPETTMTTRIYYRNDDDDDDMNVRNNDSVFAQHGTVLLFDDEQSSRYDFFSSRRNNRSSTNVQAWYVDEGFLSVFNAALVQPTGFSVSSVYARAVAYVPMLVHSMVSSLQNAQEAEARKEEEERRAILDEKRQQQFLKQQKQLQRHQQYFEHALHKQQIHSKPKIFKNQLKKQHFKKTNVQRRR